MPDSVCYMRPRGSPSPIPLSNQLGRFKDEISSDRIILSIIVIAVKIYRIVTAKKSFFDDNKHLNDEQINKLIYDCSFTSDTTQLYKDLKIKYNIKCKGVKMSDMHESLLTPEIWGKLATDTLFGVNLSQQKIFKSHLKSMGGYTMQTSAKTLSSIIDKRNHLDYLEDPGKLSFPAPPFGFQGPLPKFNT